MEKDPEAVLDVKHFNPCLVFTQVGGKRLDLGYFLRKMPCGREVLQLEAIGLSNLMCFHT